MTSGAESRAPLTIERDLGDETERGVSATWVMLARQTRNGARNGTTARSLAESACHDSDPMETMASPSSIASLRTTRRLTKPAARKAKWRLSSVAQPRRIAKGDSIFPIYRSLAARTEMDAAATQIGQFTPASAENRRAAPIAA